VIEDLLMAAADHGFTGRVRKLLARGVNPDGLGTGHPIYQGRSPVQEAALAGHLDIVSALVDAGASWEHDEVDMLLAAATGGHRDTVAELLASDPGVRQRAIERSPEQLVRAAAQHSHAAVALLIELGFDVNAGTRTAPLHEAAMRGNLRVTGCCGHTAPTRRSATPATTRPRRGLAEHHGQHEAQLLLEAHEQSIADAEGGISASGNADRDRGVHGRLARSIRQARRAALARHRLARTSRRRRRRSAVPRAPPGA
jgi:hypothetical protein